MGERRCSGWGSTRRFGHSDGCSGSGDAARSAVHAVDPTGAPIAAGWTRRYSRRSACLGPQTGTQAGAHHPEQDSTMQSTCTEGSTIPHTDPGGLGPCHSILGAGWSLHGGTIGAGERRVTGVASSSRVTERWSPSPSRSGERTITSVESVQAEHERFLPHLEEIKQTADSIGTGSSKSVLGRSRSVAQRYASSVRVRCLKKRERDEDGC